MLLKRLELSGFKSFAGKTELDFPFGITGIVGPNGSGKSNVIDAIRWLLGERDAKNIRGGKVEDLIFAGTPKRPRVGLAEAKIVFDNSSKFFPVDFTEVAVSRRVARDGESSYYINDAEVRLRDLVQFFAGSRLGTRGLTIINQGSSDIFVRATPKERRAMIEEILGLRQYQLKKHEAERKLITTKFNLEKVGAMIEELAPHLRLLRKQATRFEKQAELQTELTELEQKYFGFKLGQIASEKAALAPRRATLEREIDVIRGDLERLESELKAIEKSGPKDNAKFDEYKVRRSKLFEKRAELQRELGRLEAKIEFTSTGPRAELSSKRAVTLLEEIRVSLREAVGSGDFGAVRMQLVKLAEKIDEALQGESHEVEKTLKNLRAESDALTKKLIELDRELEELAKLESQFTGKLEEFNVAFKKGFEQVEAKRRELTGKESELQKLGFEEERLKMRGEEVATTARQVGRKISDFQAISDLILDVVDDCEKRMWKLRAELAAIGELDESLIKEAKEAEARHTFLSTQVADLEKASADLETLIHDLDSKLHTIFSGSLKSINDQFNHFFRLMFGGGKGHLKLVKPAPKPVAEEEAVTEEKGEVTAGAAAEETDAGHSQDHGGIEIELSIPRKKIQGLDMLSGGERSLVSIAALFALISVSPPPFLVLDEVDAALDEGNARRFANIVKDFSSKTQFIIVTHNRATMESADILYGVTMGEDGTSKVLSLKLDNA